MTAPSHQPWILRRRPRGNPRKRRRRVGTALHRGPLRAAEVVEYPTPATYSSARTNTISGVVAIGLHAGVLLLLVVAAALAPPELVEKLLPVELLRPDEPAPAPRAIAEVRAAFAPAAQALAPQIVNPDVVARAAPAVAAEALQMDAVAPVAAPTEVARRQVTASAVQAMRSVVSATPSPVAITSVSPALRGPIEVKAPVGPSVGPRAVAIGGDSMGLAAPGALGTGSSVREGLASDRDVNGSASGPRLASVNTRVGNSLWGRGPGGEGSGNGISFEACTARPEVLAYMDMIRHRMYSRWVVPPDIPSDHTVTLRFKLDPAGSAADVKLVEAADRRFGESAVDALRSAAPFPPMSDRVRCLARDRLKATFSNPSAGTS